MSSSSTEKPFKISISDSKIDLLQQKLALATFPDELDGSGWDYGVPLAEVQRLVTYWREQYDWRKAETALNDELPQFTRTVSVEDFGEIEVHYVHKRSEVKGAIPLLFVHGWPGSFTEVRKILPLLIKPDSPDHPSFHVVGISLPGFGFSETPKRPGFAPAQHAEACNNLMVSLGYSQYVTQGGDWGSHITRIMAHVYGGKHHRAWHSNYPTGPAPTIFQPLHYLRDLVTPALPREQAIASRTAWFSTQGKAYYEQQSTQPQTLGYSVADSPVGLLAWIYEKLVKWSDGYTWADDEVLTWVSIYWFSRAGPTAASRIYYESVKAGERNYRRESSIPMGASFFPKELRYSPRTHILSWANLVFESEHERGGHFAAHEQPKALVNDLQRMFGKGGPAYGVVEGQDGY